MARLDAYLRSIEKFGASGAVLTSNQAVMLRFPTGDRHATQVTPHDQLVAMVREVAPPAALDLIDGGRPARFSYESYTIGVAPKPGAWAVAIEPGAATPPARPEPMATPTRAATPPPVAVTAAAPDMTIERGQYDGPATVERVTASGSVLLDDLTRAARSSRASDLYLSVDAPPLQRVEGQLQPMSGAMGADQLSRELGVVAPAEARGAWAARGTAVFAYGDGMGRVRVTLGRDHRGPCAALRLLPDEPPPLNLLGLRFDELIDRSGLVVIAGASGSGKTLALASLVRAYGERRRRVVAIEEPIELVQAGAWISQREVGRHVDSVAAGVAAAIQEGADVIAVSAVTSAEAALAVADALAAGHTVVTTVAAPLGQALERLVDRVPADRREATLGILASAHLGTVGARGRTFELIRADRRG